MRKWICSIMALVLAMCGILSGCENSAQKNNTGNASTAYSIYYLNADETELIKKAYEPEKETRDTMIPEMLQMLKEQKAEGDSLALLPEGVYITTYDIHEKTLTLDFTRKYLKMKAVREVLVRGGLVRMFLQVPGIVYVQFTVEGEELLDSKGEVIGPMSSDTFVDQAGKDINSYQYTTLTLYFANDTGDRLIPEKRSVYYNSNVSLENVVLDQLLKGPRSDANRATLPSGTSILSVTSADDTCYVNFDKGFSEDALALQESIPIYSIVNSLVDNCKVKKVQISLNGETDLTFRETMRLDKFYQKNEELIDEEVPEEEAQEEVAREPQATDIVTAAPAKPGK